MEPKDVVYILITFVVAVLAFMFGGITGQSYGLEVMQKQAVARGFATYSIESNNNISKFQWVEPIRDNLNE